MGRDPEWHVQRTVMAHVDGERRWDTAYQLLLQWAQAHKTARQAQSAAQPQEEDAGPGGLVCAGVDHPAAADADA